VTQAEAKAAQFQAALQDREAQNFQLAEDMSTMEEELTKLKSVQKGVGLEALQQQLTQAEAMVIQLQRQLEDKELQNMQLADGVTAMEKEILQYQAGHGQQADHEALLERATFAEDLVTQLRASVEERTLQNRQLAEGVTAMEQEIAELRAGARGPGPGGPGAERGGAHGDL